MCASGRFGCGRRSTAQLAAHRTTAQSASMILAHSKMRRARRASSTMLRRTFAFTTTLTERDQLMTSKKIRVAVAIALLAPLAATSAQADECTWPTVAASSSRPQSFMIAEPEVTAEQMTALWKIAVQAPSFSTHFFGKTIAADQNWLGNCTYPGIGLGVSSGRVPGTKSITFWVWENSTDIVAARVSLLAYASPTTTTTIAESTTTTMMPTTTTTTTAVTTATVSNQVFASRTATSTATTATSTATKKKKKKCRTVRKRVFSKKINKFVIAKRKVCK
jgi:hypothetical protein